MNSKATAEKEDLINNQINKAMGVMLNYGFIGLTRERLVAEFAAMNFLKGVLRQHGLTEGDIEEVRLYLEAEQENKAKTTT